MMNIADKIARVNEQLQDVRREQARQMQYAGERFGVFARLKELERDERRLVKRLDALQAVADPSPVAPEEDRT